jgi:hypothetical protein
MKVARGLLLTVITPWASEEIFNCHPNVAIRLMLVMISMEGVSIRGIIAVPGWHGAAASHCA